MPRPRWVELPRKAPALLTHWGLCSSSQDLVKNHLMYAVREEVEVLKEQIKELAEKNSQLERENSLLKNLASPEQLQKFRSRLPLEALSPAATEKMSPGAAAPAQHRAGSAV